MNKESLKEYLSSRYQGWNSFLSNVIFPIFGENDFEDGFETELLESQPERRQLAEATGIRSIKQVGMMYVGVEPLQIFDVTVSGSSVLSWTSSLVLSCCSITRMTLVGIGVSPIVERAVTKKNPPTANAIRSCWGLVSHAARQLTTS